eukprot:CAMPEP_0178992790 /NCGR_PEP_ID=MMETSP0795-20121207/6314_1 /TAXON_ID=88552 /ORGANISM="Amoebophrya sp., Strain Ameob2" /LENGTH=1011 /DNA_ID=CAMNT_0020684719 /DNA_START=418 /DNA_END=3453 /DNA_ORIENTATION=-
MLPSPVPPPFEGDGNDPPLPTLPWGDMPHDSSDSEELLSPAGRNKRKEDRMVRKIYKKYTSETSDGERRDPSGASQSGNEMKRARRAAPPLVSGGSDSDSDQSWSYRYFFARNENDSSALSESPPPPRELEFDRHSIHNQIHPHAHSTEWGGGGSLSSSAAALHHVGVGGGGGQHHSSAVVDGVGRPRPAAQAAQEQHSTAYNYSHGSWSSNSNYHPNHYGSQYFYQQKGGSYAYGRERAGEQEMRLSGGPQTAASSSTQAPTEAGATATGDSSYHHNYSYGGSTSASSSVPPQPVATYQHPHSAARLQQQQQAASALTPPPGGGGTSTMTNLAKKGMKKGGGGPPPSSTTAAAGATSTFYAGASKGGAAAPSSSASYPSKDRTPLTGGGYNYNTTPASSQHQNWYGAAGGGKMYSYNGGGGWNTNNASWVPPGGGGGSWDHAARNSSWGPPPGPGAGGGQYNLQHDHGGQQNAPQQSLQTSEAAAGGGSTPGSRGGGGAVATAQAPPNVSISRGPTPELKMPVDLKHQEEEDSSSTTKRQQDLQLHIHEEAAPGSTHLLGAAGTTSRESRERDGSSTGKYMNRRRSRRGMIAKNAPNLQTESFLEDRTREDRADTPTSEVCAQSEETKQTQPGVGGSQGPPGGATDSEPPLSPFNKTAPATFFARTDEGGAALKLPSTTTSSALYHRDKYLLDEGEARYFKDDGSELTHGGAVASSSSKVVFAEAPGAPRAEGEATGAGRVTEEAASSSTTGSRSGEAVLPVVADDAAADFGVGVFNSARTEVEPASASPGKNIMKSDEIEKIEEEERRKNPEVTPDAVDVSDGLRLRAPRADGGFKNFEDEVELPQPSNNFVLVALWLLVVCSAASALLAPQRTLFSPFAGRSKKGQVTARTENTPPEVVLKTANSKPISAEVEVSKLLEKSDFLGAERLLATSAAARMDQTDPRQRPLLRAFAHIGQGKNLDAALRELKTHVTGPPQEHRHCGAVENSYGYLLFLLQQDIPRSLQHFS